MTPEQDLYEVVWLAAFGHLEQVHAGVRASDLRATVLGIIRALEASGLVVVSREDLAVAVQRLPHAHQRSGVWDMDNGDRCGTVCDQCAAWERLRAALTESQTVDE